MSPPYTGVLSSGTSKYAMDRPMVTNPIQIISDIHAASFAFAGILGALSNAAVFPYTLRKISACTPTRANSAIFVQ